ncbi:DUF6415 family natural product biosynthesis protein [Streptomyces sp. NPDC004111]|uniref:DUF6415 family natural product biosynthesis protein n=1 Tax=Streptomyces sp. NPDC004111 TaxID=3364690 RepID=UPI0036AE1A43
MPDHHPQFTVEPAAGAHDYPLDTALMAATVQRAHRALRSHPLPRPDDTELLTSLLHSHLVLLVRETRPVLAAMDHGTLEWDRQKAVHDAARRALEAGPTHGLAAAATHLRELATGVERLLALLADAHQGADHT